MTESAKIPSAELPLTTLLSGTGQALHDLTALLGKLEAQLLRDIAHLKANNTSVTILQSVDLMTQTLTELAALVHRLKDQVPPEQTVDAATVVHPVRLSRLHDQLLRGELVKAGQQAQQAKGDIALF